MDIQITTDKTTVIFRGVPYTKGTETYIKMVNDVARELFTIDDYEQQLNNDYGTVTICGSNDYGEGTITRKMMGEAAFTAEYEEIVGYRIGEYERYPETFFLFVQRC